MTLPHAPRPERGFTLLEVIVAFAIAAILLVAMLRSLTLGLDGSRRAEAYTRAVTLAESALDSLGVAAPLRDGDAAELQEGPFRIRAAVQHVSDLGPGQGLSQYFALYRLSATVSWREGHRERQVALETRRVGAKAP